MLNRCYGLKNVARVDLCRPFALSSLTAASHLRGYNSSAEPRNIGILGGGITGLVSAYYFSKNNPGAKITIYESGPRLGGWLHSDKVEVDDGYVLFEKGPRTLRPAGNGVLTARLVSDLGLSDDTIFTMKTATAATNRFIYYPDHLVRVPQPDKKLGFLGNATAMANSFTTEEVFQGILGRALLEPFRPTRDLYMSDESIGSFFARRVGRKVVDQVISAVIHGIYAGDVYQLSMRSLFPKVWDMEFDHGSIFNGVIDSMSSNGVKTTVREAKFMEAMVQPHPFGSEFRKNFRNASVFTFREGIQQMVDSLKADLTRRMNVDFKLNSSVSDIEMENEDIKVSINDGRESFVHDHIISTLSPTALNKFIYTPENDVPKLIAPGPTVMTVNLYYRTPGLHPPGFGYLIPLATSIDQNPERALGVVFDTAYSASMTEEDKDIIGPPQDIVSNRGSKVTVMLGGHYWDDWTAYPSADEGLQMAQSVLQRHLGITEKPAAHAVNLQEKCIPQYTVGYADRLRKVHEELLRKYSGRLRVAGNWIRGVGVNDCIRSAWEVTNELGDAGKTGLEPAVEERKMVSFDPPRRKKLSSHTGKS